MQVLFIKQNSCLRGGRQEKIRSRRPHPRQNIDDELFCLPMELCHLRDHTSMFTGIFQVHHFHVSMCVCVNVCICVQWHMCWLSTGSCSTTLVRVIKRDIKSLKVLLQQSNQRTRHRGQQQEGANDLCRLVPGETLKMDFPHKCFGFKVSSKQNGICYTLFQLLVNQRCITFRKNKCYTVSECMVLILGLHLNII